MSDTVCIYHGNCADGFSSAWAVWKVHPEWVFHPGTHGNLPPDVTGKDVYLLDFSYKRPIIEEMLKQANRITILDHHLSALNDVGSLVADGHIDGVIDMERSGCRIAWDWFHPGETPPKLLLHMEDRDLWKFELPGTKEIQEAVFSYPYTFSTWDYLMMGNENIRPHCVLSELFNDGKAILRKKDKDVQELIAIAKTTQKIGGYEVPVVNTPYFYTSEVGEILAKNAPFAATYYDTAENRVYSLRSSKDGLDVSKIAEGYGGGGHKHAAGFRVPLGSFT